MNVSRDSLHYRLFNSYSDGCRWDLENGRVNFCQYSCKVMIGCLVVLLCILVGSVLGLGLMQVVGSLALWAFTDNPLMPFIADATSPENFYWLGVVGILSTIIAGVEGMAILVIAVVFGSFFVRDRYWEWQKTHQGDGPVVEKEPGFFATWYSSWKDKYCPMMSMEKLVVSNPGDLIVETLEEIEAENATAKAADDVSKL